MFFFHSINEAHCDKKSFETESCSVTDKLCLFSFCYLLYQFVSFLLHSCRVKKETNVYFCFFRACLSKGIMWPTISPSKSEAYSVLAISKSNESVNHLV